MQTNVMNANRLFKFSLVGAVVTAICCFTPVLPILLGGLGLAAILAYADMVLLPLLALFLGLTAYAWWKRRSA